MSSRYDLHAHTVCSDGILTPAELVARARAQGVEVLALTDHDTTEGVSEAAAAAAAAGIALIPGAEISVTWEGQTVHVVGLGLDPANPVLAQGLARQRAFRDWRAQEIARRLEKRRIHGALEGAARLARGSILSRTHFARFLLEQGYVRSAQRAFKQFLARGGAAYVPGKWAALPEVVGWIRDAGGQAVIAHPARYPLSAGRLRRLITEFKDCGGAGIEVVCGRHDPQANLRFAAVALEHGLLASLGSDYHGLEGPWVDLGRLAPLPESCTPVWHDWKVLRTEDSGLSSPPSVLGPQRSVLSPQSSI